MPEAFHHAFEFHLSPAIDVLGTWTQELVNACDRYLWYALKHETGESGKVHVHMAVVLEHATAKLNGGAQTASNFARSVRNRCPELKSWLCDHPSKKACVCAPLKSDEFIVEYMQKEGELVYSRMPRDLNELRPYFADLQTKKIQNPDYDKWENMYVDEDRPLPATPASVWSFLKYHMHTANDMKIVADPKKIRERSICLAHHVNHLVDEEENPFVKKVKATHDSRGMPYDAYHRTCPRCLEQPLEPRQQYCAACKKY